jgi:LacI family transcriptional regulator
MSTIRLLAEELQLSRVTVSAALRGLPWVKSTTRDRILRRAKQRGFAERSGPDAFAGMLGFLRVKGHTQRGRAAVERHRVICRAAKDAAYEAGYGVEELVVGADELDTLPAVLAASGCGGLLVLPVPSEDLLRRVWSPSVPCVYTDVPPDTMNVDSVCPDYHQAIFLAFGRLRELGFKRPGLMLDNHLPLPARERVRSAYGWAFNPGGGVAPSLLFTPVRSVDIFESWLGRHSFDVLLSTDPEHARRLTSEFELPVFGLMPEMNGAESGLDLNLSAVGRQAFEILHNRLARPGRSTAASRVFTSASWSGVVAPPCTWSIESAAGG